LHSEHVISKSGIAVSPTRTDRGPSILLFFGALAWRFFQPQVVGRKRLYLKHYAGSWRPDWLSWLSVLLKMTVFKFLLQIVGKKVWRDFFNRPAVCCVCATGDGGFTVNSVGTRVARYAAHELSIN
jgi:hypothetical protein